jgi:hypothetical protein
MPASLIILPAVVVALAAWLAAWLYTRSSAKPTARDELQRLRNHAAWLEQRLDTARQERWDPEMIVSLSNQLGVACEELSRAQGRTRSSATAHVP